jgi:hypothetical protein
MEKLFPLGKVSLTHGVNNLIQGQHEVLNSFLKQHVSGEWGTLDEEDKLSNENALKYGGRLLSVYELHEVMIWIVTEADRSCSTFLLPWEF